MLDRLFDYLNDEAYEEDDWEGRLDAVQFGDETVLSIKIIKFSDSFNPLSAWVMKVLGLRIYEIKGRHGIISLTEDDHVLARQLTDATQDLSFYGKPECAEATIGRLYQAHLREVGSWISFEKYMNGQISLDALLAGGFGKLAEGPSFLMRAYAKVLSDDGIKPSLLAPRPSMRWEDGRWIADKSSLATLVIGDAYFVAENFEIIEGPIKS